MIPETKNGVRPQEFVLRVLTELMRSEEEARLAAGWMQSNNPAWVDTRTLFQHVGDTKFAAYDDFMALLQNLALEERVFLDYDPEHRLEVFVRVRLVGEEDLHLCARQSS
jgi:uncharacterized protein (DUF2267 family)